MSAARQFEQSPARQFVQSPGRQRNRIFGRPGFESVTAQVPFAGFLPFEFDSHVLQLTRYLKSRAEYIVDGTEEDGTRVHVEAHLEYNVSQQTACSTFEYGDSCGGANLAGPPPDSPCYVWFRELAGLSNQTTWPLTFSRSPLLITGEYHDDFTSIAFTRRLSNENNIGDCENRAQGLLDLISGPGPYSGCFDAQNHATIYFGLDIPASIAAAPPLGSEITDHILLGIHCDCGGTYLWPSPSPGVKSQRLWYGGETGQTAGIVNQDISVILTKGRVRTNTGIPLINAQIYNPNTQVFTGFENRGGPFGPGTYVFSVPSGQERVFA